MADFINTIDLLGDDAVMDSIIDRTIAEFKDDQITKINGSGAFKGCSQLKTVWLPNADFDGTTQIGYQFDSCTSLVDIQIPSAKTLGRLMFNNCTSLEHLVLPSVTKLNMQTFVNCSNLTTLDFYKTINTFGTGHINWCSKLKGIIFRGDGVVPCGSNPKWDTTPYQDGTGYIYVPGSLVNSYKSAENWSTIAEQFRGILGDEEGMQGIIDETLVDYENNEIESIPTFSFYNYALLKSVKSTSVTEVNKEAFRNCTGLETVSLPNVVTVKNEAFDGCTMLKDVELQSVNEISSGAFAGCTSLTECNIPNVTKLGFEPFKNSSIVKLVLPKLTNATSQAFRTMPKLEIADLPVCTQIGGLVFQNSSSLKALILRSPTLCTLENVNSLQGSWEGNTGGVSDGNYTQIHYGRGYIYVPRALVDSYKVAENWSTYASQFRALEDYTVDGTTTGELDESKI